MKTIRDEIAEKYPVAVERAKTSRSTAIKLACYECCGGSYGEAKKCTVTTCFLFPFSPAAAASSKGDSEKSAAGKARWDALSPEEKAERIAKLKAKKPEASEQEAIDEEPDDDDLA